MILLDLVRQISFQPYFLHLKQAVAVHQKVSRVFDLPTQESP